MGMILLCQSNFTSLIRFYIYCKETHHCHHYFSISHTINFSIFISSYRDIDIQDLSLQCFWKIFLHWKTAIVFDWNCSMKFTIRQLVQEPCHFCLFFRSKYLNLLSHSDFCVCIITKLLANQLLWIRSETHVKQHSLKNTHLNLGGRGEKFNITEANSNQFLQSIHSWIWIRISL